MSMTNFNRLTDEQKTIWSMDFWKTARNYAFTTKFSGKSSDSIIQRITELKKTEKGARAVITLVADLVGDGVAGDRTLEGNEEAMRSYDQVIEIDQLRHANRNEGKMSEQASVVTFREQSRDKLAYWHADRYDQMAFLAMSGVSFAFHTNGAPRVGSDLPFLTYAADVVAPSTNRHRRWDATLGLVEGDTAAVEDGDTPTYAMIVELKAFAKNNFVRPIRTKDGIEFYHMFLSPNAMAKLKLDSDYLANIRSAGNRGMTNELFKGTDTVMVDGVAISDYRHVFNTVGAASGSKWGPTGIVDGQRSLFCGAQALGMADIGDASWVEKGFDYDNQQGISVGKIAGILKPQFQADVTDTVEDFGLIVCDTSIK